MTEPVWHYVTFFPDIQAASKSAEEMTLDALADEIRGASAPTKAELPWLKLARFGDKRTNHNCLRSDANVLGVSGVEIDHDAATMTFDEAIARMRAARLTGVVYTSASYIRGEKEKWRVLAPFSKEREPKLRKEMAAALNGVLDGAAASESFGLSQSFYYGRAADAELRVELIEGDFIDLRPDLISGKRYKNQKPKDDRTRAGPAPAATPVNRIEVMAALTAISADCSYEIWRNVGAALAHQFGDEGFALFDDWSATAAGLASDNTARYTAEKAARQWKACQTMTDISIGTVFHYANEAVPDWRARYQANLAGAIGEQIAGITPPGRDVTLPADLPNWRERARGGVKPAASLHNACLAIASAGLTCSHDTFHNKMFIGRGEAADPGVALPRHCGEVTDASVMALRGFLSVRYGFDLQDKHVRDAIMLLAGGNAFNPVTDMLAEAEASWDGVPRLDRMAVDHFGCADTPLNRACVRKTMIAAVARARVPGVKFDTILVLESPEGWNKSSAWALLAGEGNFSDERIIGKDSREVVEQLAGIWIHENADLAGMRKAEVETVKAYASRVEDRARPAYAHFLIVQPRHSIEIGTTNNDTYLQSQTGNRRFWPIRMERRIDLALLRAERLQLWGEAAHYQSQGEALTLPEALWGDAAVAQEARRVRDAWEDILEERLIPVRQPASGPMAGVMHQFGIVQVTGTEWRVATRDIFRSILGLPEHMQDDRHTKRLANAMRALRWTRIQFRSDDDVVRGYVKEGKKGA